MSETLTLPATLLVSGDLAELIFDDVDQTEWKVIATHDRDSITGDPMTYVALRSITDPLVTRTLRVPASEAIEVRRG